MGSAGGAAKAGAVRLSRRAAARARKTVGFTSAGYCGAAPRLSILAQLVRRFRLPEGLERELVLARPLVEGREIGPGIGEFRVDLHRLAEGCDSRFIIPRLHGELSAGEG